MLYWYIELKIQVFFPLWILLQKYNFIRNCNFVCYLCWYRCIWNSVSLLDHFVKKLERLRAYNIAIDLLIEKCAFHLIGLYSSIHIKRHRFVLDQSCSIKQWIIREKFESSTFFQRYHRIKYHFDVYHITQTERNLYKSECLFFSNCILLILRSYLDYIKCLIIADIQISILVAIFYTSQNYKIKNKDNNIGLFRPDENSLLIYNFDKSSKYLNFKLKICVINFNNFQFLIWLLSLFDFLHLNFKYCIISRNVQSLLK